MKKIYLFAAVVFLAACNSNTGKPTTENMKAADSGSAKQEKIIYPYTAEYSSDFAIGSSKNVQTILEMYKNWDNNKLDNSRNSFAEIDTMYFSDGGIFSGSRDSLFARANRMREQISSMDNAIQAFVPLRSKDKNEDWVLIWTRETSTDTKGKKTSRDLHEIWRFDNNGKINLMYQYEQQLPKMEPPSPKK
ncbi:MAG: hypothetical protein J7578_10095 [Chitinophagaceae bacterium]|nr:hypothetical protein [Chitinophagaceae bacterium]